MSILYELQSRKLGLIELLSMGFDVYLKNLKPMLLCFCTIMLPSTIGYFSFFKYNINNFSALALVLDHIALFAFYTFATIYSIAISVITDNYVHGRNTSYQSVAKKIISSFIPLFCLFFLFAINIYLRFLLFFIPCIIYAINNSYYGLAFILRDQRGKAAFAYSRSIVRGNRWRVFFFFFFVLFTAFGLQIIFTKLLNIIPFMNDFWVFVLSHTLVQFIGIGISISGILLFLNLDFQKSLES